MQQIEAAVSGAGFTFVRPSSGHDRSIDVNGLHLSAAGGATGWRSRELTATGSSVTLRGIDLSATSAALDLQGLPATIEDSRLRGATTLLAPAVGATVFANVHLDGGALRVGSRGGSLTIADCIVRSVAMVTIGIRPVRIINSRVDGGSAQGVLAAPLLLDTCHLSGTRTGPQTTVRNPLPAPQLGSLEVTPLRPNAGGSVTLSTDLPAGLRGYWFFGFTARVPVIQRRPFHVYMGTFGVVAVPHAVRRQSRSVVWIPNWPGARGADLFFQLAVLPDPGVRAPVIAAPPGRRVVIQ